jgi:hypothetical protein
VRVAWLLLVSLALPLAGCDDGKSPKGVGPGDDTDVAQPADDTGPSDDFHDPLSTPTEPTLDLDDFVSAEQCAECHPDHVSEWRQSVHAHAMTDPVFRALVAVRHDAFDGEQDAFCIQCHSAIGTRSHDITPGFAWDALDDRTLEGVNCEACHRIQSIVRPFNAGHELDGTGPMRGPILDPEPSAFHTTEPAEWMAGAEFCGTCHDVYEVNGLPLERPYAEWLPSPAADEGRPCQTCHMPSRTGPAATGGPDRTLHDHRFVGVDVPESLDAETRAGLRQEVDALLEGAGTVSLALADAVPAGGQLDVVVTVQNEIDAHNLPTGSSFNRQCWVEVIATDGAGRVLYETGTFDGNGDLRDHWSELDPYGDSDLLAFHGGLVDADGQPTRLTHDAIELRTRALQPLHARTWTLFVPVPADAVGPIAVTARLRFRAYGPHLFRLLGLPNPEEGLVVTDIDAVAEVVAVQ